MCMMCGGSSFDDALGKVLQLVDDVGWALVPIDGGGGGGWVYRVGLASRGHPELVTAAPNPASTGRAPT